MIAKHDGHSFDADLIAKDDWVMDVGCRGFTLAKSLPLAKVISLDPAPDIPSSNALYYRAALVPDDWQGPCALAMTADINGRSILPQATGERVGVNTISIPAIMRLWKIEQFALIKLDCEGSEYALMHEIARLGPITRQISVEYHDFCGLNPQSDMEAWYADLHERLAPHYDVVRHVREIPEWGGHDAHYVDSLYMLHQ